MQQTIQVFNRRRAEEIERLTIADFETCQTIDETTDCDIFNSLTEQSRKGAQQYFRFEIRGKLARNVAVLLHIHHLKSIKLLIRNRAAVGVSQNNPYIFGVPGGDNTFLRACILLRKFSSLCGAKQPKILRGTELRKQIATQSVLLDLQENEIADLANFMGHAEKIHKDHYRLPIVTRDIVRMSCLLERVQGTKSTVDSMIIDTALDKENSYEYEAVGNGIEAAFYEENNNMKETLDAEYDNQANRKKRSETTIYWTNSEKEVMKMVFGEHLKNKTVSSLHECRQAMVKYPELHIRRLQTIKAWIYNQI